MNALVKQSPRVRAGVKKNAQSWSIVYRLTLFYTIAAVALLLFAGVFLYWGLKKNLENQDRDTLSDKIAVLRDILIERPGDDEALKEEVEWESSARKHVVYYARLIDTTGKTIMESPDAAELLPGASSFPAPTEPATTIGSVREFRPASGRTFLLTSIWSPADGYPGDRLQYQVALDISGERAILADYRTKLSAVVCCGILISAAFGMLIARRAMDPVREITSAAQRISANALQERISAWQWPRELGALAAEFDRMLQRLEDSFERLSQFSADIAHELRTPVNNLMGETEVALTRPRTSEEYRRVLESSLEEYHRLATMIDRMLFLSRADNASIHLERSRFSGRKALDSICAYYEALAHESGVNLIALGEGDLDADPGLFRRAVSNLIANAIYHTPSGGTVSASIQAEGKLIEIADDGSGIAPEHLNKLFDRFYRADAARTSHRKGTGQPKGTGLGLAIVKAIMDLHGGIVAIESEVGKGTKVALRFP